MAGYGDGPVVKRQRKLETSYEQDFNNFNQSFNSKSGPHHVLSMNVLNPNYPITCDVLNKICTPTGRVLRIVIFKKSGVQALVEFDSVESATRTKDKLSGKDIYSGCCTLQIEYAYNDKLRVTKNDEESWDYTTAGDADRPSLLQQPTTGYSTTTSGGWYGNGGQMAGQTMPMGQMQGQMGPMANNMGGGMSTGMPGQMGPNMTGQMGGGMTGPMGPGMGGPMGPGMGGPMGAPMGMGGNMGNQMGNQMGPNMGGAMAANTGNMGGMSGYNSGAAYGMSAQGPRDNFYQGYQGFNTAAMSTGYPTGGDYSHYNENSFNSSYGGGRPNSPSDNPGCVLMIYGIDQDVMNCDKLFNLFCLYGNVFRVKFLKSKERCAMVQMGDPEGAQRVLNNLNGVEFFKKQMSLSLSKHMELQDVVAPFDLPDGSPSYKEYIGIRNNRFANADAARKNRIQAPSKVLHFFNAPPDITEPEIHEIFEKAETAPPLSIKCFSARNEKSSSGILEFTSILDATEAVIKCNHSMVKLPTGKFPYTFKLCFSNANFRPRDENN